MNSVVAIPVNAVVPALTVRPRAQWPLLSFFMCCYVAGWIGLWVAPLARPVAVDGAARPRGRHFAMVLTLFGLAGVARLWAPGWLVTRPRFVDEEVDRSVTGWSTAGRPRGHRTGGSAGAEARVSTQVRPGDGSLRG